MFAHNKIDFHSNRVLKAEFLQEATDYTEEMLGHIYGNYSDGILEGVDITVNDWHLTVHPGIIKYRGILYHMDYEEQIPYEHSERKMFLRIRFLEANQYEDNTQYTSEFVLTDTEATFPYEMELGRFVAEKGATLFMDEMDLEGMSVKYNQFDTRNVPYAGIGESTLSPKLTLSFGKQLLEKNTENYYDIAFAMQCLNKRPVEREMIYSYLSKRTGSRAENLTNEEICKKFLEILRECESGSRQVKKQSPKPGRRVIVD